MNVVRHAADAICFAIHVARDRSQIGVEFRARVGNEEGAAFLRAEDDVDDDEGEGLWHGDIGFRAKGPIDSSLGQRPSNGQQMFPSANGAVHRTITSACV